MSAPEPAGVPCPRCDGTGSVDTRTGPLYWQVQRQRCWTCQGLGRIAAEPPATTPTPAAH